MKNALVLAGILIAWSTSAQNVGIGTTQPQARLHLQQTAGEVLRVQSSDPYISFFDNNGNYQGFLWLNKLFGNDMRLGTTQGSGVAISLQPNNTLALYAAINGRVGLGTTAPAARLDVLGNNAWDLINGEGDLRIGNPNYRLKMGIALDGGGTGAAGIMQAGGIGNLAIGAGAKYLLQLNGPGGFVDLSNNTGGLRINGNAGAPGQFMISNGNAAPQWKSLSDIQAAQSANTTGFQIIQVTNADQLTGVPINLIIPPNATAMLWFRINTAKGCVIGPCHYAFEFRPYLNNQPIEDVYYINTVSFPSSINQTTTIGPVVLTNRSGNNTLTYKINGVFGQSFQVAVKTSWAILHN